MLGTSGARAAAAAVALRALGLGRGRGTGTGALSVCTGPPAGPEPQRDPAVAAVPLAPVLLRCSVPVPARRSPVQAWVSSLAHPEAQHRGLAELHPDVFSVGPRLDVLHEVAMWQKNYRRISYAKVRTRAEVRGGGRKPWRQKGTGRARHGSIRSPLWRGGGIAHGPRGPTSYYYLPPLKVRALGLSAALTVKLMQDDLHLVEDLELPTPDPRYLQDLARFRHWGSSVLIVDVNEPPENMKAAVSALKTFTLIPALALSVHSLLKHQALVLSVAAVSFLEPRLLWHRRRFGPIQPLRLPQRDLPWAPAP